ncbi:EAL domain-containing protein [Pseudoalteromonas luteoviolacea]|uniref:EAL domain-containing protein n=1 Tax=Pseudoalteromonas luteoviolacea TaxID=43657 RepID=UPI001B361FC1|nr:EAL domain-containing protein [Pseudoalteromonas luteoviolacea]
MTPNQLLSTGMKKFLIPVDKGKLKLQGIVFEITEHPFDTISKLQLLDRIYWLKSLHAKIVIDDFGVCHSDFKRCLIIPLDFIKLDKSFVEFSKINEHRLVETTSIFHGINKDVILEGLKA